MTDAADSEIWTGVDLHAVASELHGSPGRLSGPQGTPRVEHCSSAVTTRQCFRKRITLRYFVSTQSSNVPFEQS